MPALSRNCDPSTMPGRHRGGKPGRRPARIPSDVPEEGQMAHVLALIVAAPSSQRVLV
jgi:hypothetical protein